MLRSALSLVCGSSCAEIEVTIKMPAIWCALDGQWAFSNSAGSIDNNSDSAVASFSFGSP